MNLYNTLTKTKEKLKPLEDNKIKMYVCGVTPYDTTHLGHATTYLFFDSLKRYLEFNGFDVVYVQNVTDVDDSILQKAREVKKNWRELGEYWTDRFLEDLKALNVEMPTHYVKATDSMAKIIDMVKNLSEGEFAYEKNGNVYFDISKFPKYGELSGYNREEMIKLSKERGANPKDPNKKDPLDFVLWQKSLQDEPFWESPWGKGRPGWHIECSAMINRYLGDQIDIHGGGSDLIYPHHESEIAQSESYTHISPFTKFWVHVGMVYYKGEKMSKSLGNLVLVKDLLEKYEPNAIRWMLLSHHYRNPWEFKEEDLEEAKQKLERTLGNIDNSKNPNLDEFTNALDDDFNSPKALEIIENSPNPKKMLEILGFKLS